MKENTMDLSVKVSQVSRWDLDYYRWLRYPNDNVVFPCHFILPSTTRVRGKPKTSVKINGA